MIKFLFMDVHYSKSNFREVCSMDKEDKKMATALNQKYAHLKDKLDAISKGAPVRTGKDGMIELDPKNPDHLKWYEKDKYKGE